MYLEIAQCVKLNDRFRNVGTRFSLRFPRFVALPRRNSLVTHICSAQVATTSPAAAPAGLGKGYRESGHSPQLIIVVERDRANWRATVSTSARGRCASNFCEVAAGTAGQRKSVDRRKYRASIPPTSKPGACGISEVTAMVRAPVCVCHDLVPRPERA